jgi:mannose-6-phosphate isomerase-like protein (cupin superfamily)
MSLTRRDLFSLLPAAFLPSSLELQGTDGLAPATQDASLPSAAFPFDKLPVHNNANGSQTRHVLKGKLATGESLEVHETMLPAGGMPHPPPKHLHSEMWLIREGTLELTVNGSSYQLGPGGVGFVHSNDLHGVKNVGTTPANYFVVAIGSTAAST